MTDPISTALLILRVGVGIVFLAHGIKHLASRAKTTAWFGSIGFRAPGFQWLAMTVTEIAVGLLLVIGFLTGLAAAGVVATMLVAFVTVHRRAGFFITAFMKEGIDVEGYEYVLTLAIAALAIAIAGPGDFSIDANIEIDGVTVASYLDAGVGALLAAAGVALAALQLVAFWRPQAP